MSNEQRIRLECFSETDFNLLISWVKDEKELIQFAGQIFRFPLTTEQLKEYLKDKNRHPFKIVLNNSNIVIGHCEAYQTSNDTVKLCRIIIGDKRYRGQGLGYEATKKLIKWCIENLRPNTIELNVYDFNTIAIKCYEKLGFQRTNDSKTIILNGENWTSVRMYLDVKDQSSL